MFIANDSNYTFGQYLDRETVDIKAPVYTKCFTDTEELKGYRFVHDPEETDPEKCVSFSVYNAASEAATATPFLDKAAVTDLTSVMFRLDTIKLDDAPIREKPFYHVIVPVENIADGTLKYLVIKMTKEVEIFPDDYPYYELADTFADAQPTSAEAPSGGGGEGGGGGESEFSTATVTIDTTEIDGFLTDGSQILLPFVTISGAINVGACVLSSQSGNTFTIALYNSEQFVNPIALVFKDADENEFDIESVSGNAVYNSSPKSLSITGDCTIKLVELK